MGSVSEITTRSALTDPTRILGLLRCLRRVSLEVTGLILAYPLFCIGKRCSVIRLIHQKVTHVDALVHDMHKELALIQSEGRE